MTGKHCDLLSYLASDENTKYKELYALIEDNCWRSVFTTKREYTFLMPGKALLKKLKDTAEKDERKGYEDLRRLFINDKHKNLSKVEELITFNNKMIKKDSIKHFEDLKDISISSLKHIVILEYNVDHFPEQEDKSVRRKKTVKAGGKDEKLESYKYTNKLFSGSKISERVLCKLSSLLKYCKQNDNDKYSEIIKRIDPNWVLTWFILVQPGCTKPTYISSDMFNAWEEGNDAENLDVCEDKSGILDAFNDVKDSQKKLSESNKYRKEAEECADFHELVNIVTSSYDSELHMLEDELRFIYSDKTIEDTIENVRDLKCIDWDRPQTNLVIINSNLCRTADTDALFDCLKKFVSANSFLYTLIDNKTDEKIKEAIQKISGGGYSSSRKVLNVLGNSHRSALSKMSAGDSKQMLKAFVKSLSSSQKKILKDLL